MLHSFQSWASTLTHKLKINIFKGSEPSWTTCSSMQCGSREKTTPKPTSCQGSPIAKPEQTILLTTKTTACQCKWSPQLTCLKGQTSNLNCHTTERWKITQTESSSRWNVRASQDKNHRRRIAGKAIRSTSSPGVVLESQRKPSEHQQ